MDHYFDGFDEKSFQLGMIEAFCEVVGQGVKALALSPILTPEQWAALKPAAAAIAHRFQVNSYEEKDFIASDLCPDDAAKNKIVVLYYKDEEILDQYQILKTEAAALKRKGQYSPEEIKKISIRLRKLLSYSDEAIQNHYSRPNR